MRVMQRPNQPIRQSSEQQPILLQLVRRVRTEQGEQSASNFLRAVSPFFTTAEIMNIENVLQIRTAPPERVKSESKPQGKSGNDAQMLQMLMSLMGKGKPDPAGLMKMMGKL